MNELMLISPSEKYINEINSYKNEFIENNDSMDGTGGLKNAESIEKWLSNLNDNENEKTVQNGYVPGSVFLGVRKSDNYIVGMVAIRHRLNKSLLIRGGHIGYSVRKSERQKGYAKQILSLAVEKCKFLGIDKVLVTCDKNNIASAKTILANGGVLENEITENDNVIQRYWIVI